MFNVQKWRASGLCLFAFLRAICWFFLLFLVGLSSQHWTYLQHSCGPSCNYGLYLSAVSLYTRLKCQLFFLINQCRNWFFIFRTGFFFSGYLIPCPAKSKAEQVVCMSPSTRPLPACNPSCIHTVNTTPLQQRATVQHDPHSKHSKP